MCKNPFFKHRTINILIGLLFLFFLTSACHCDEEPYPEVQDNVLVMHFNKELLFKQAKEYQYFDRASNFTVTLREEELENGKMIHLYYQEVNGLLFKGSQLQYPQEGIVMIPEDFTSAQEFERVLTDDYVYPTGGFTVIDHQNIDERIMEKLWNQVQNLVVIRNYFMSKPEQKIYVYPYKRQIGSTESTEWLLFIKN